MELPKSWGVEHPRPKFLGASGDPRYRQWLRVCAVKRRRLSGGEKCATIEKDRSHLGLDRTTVLCIDRPRRTGCPYRQHGHGPAPPRGADVDDLINRIERRRNGVDTTRGGVQFVNRRQRLLRGNHQYIAYSLVEGGRRPEGGGARDVRPWP